MALCHDQSQPMHQLKEVFCADLPSPSCKNHIGSRIGTVSGFQDNCLPIQPPIRIATQRHCVTMSRRNVLSASGREAPGGRDVDEYSVSIKSLPAPQATEGEERQLKKHRGKKINSTATKEEGGSCVCLSHAFLVLNSHKDDLKSIEVFALARAHHHPSGIHASSDAVPSTSDSKPSHAKSASEMTSGANSLSDSIKGVDFGTTNREGITVQTSTYYLLVKIRFSARQVKGHMDSSNTEEGVLLKEDTKRSTNKTRHKTIFENIPLSFRPSIVHITNLHVSVDNNSDCDLGIPAIGIFVTSSDDNKLRLYVSSRKSLNERYLGGQHPIKPPSFALSSLSFDMKSHDNDVTTGDPFMFCSLITALEALYYYDDLHRSFVNKLAISLFDGTIHIMTLYLKKVDQQRRRHSTDSTGAKNDSAKSSLDLQEMTCRLQSSTFLVDGPVATLHFGRLNLAHICLRTNQPPMSSLFLVAGSLSGFACLFYEVTSSNHTTPGIIQDTAAFPCFNGPIPLVDELYDPVHENEDCVTAVHVCCSNDSRPIIAIGTHSGRVLLFERTKDPAYSFDESSFLMELTSKQEDVVLKMEETITAIDSFQAAKVALQLESERLVTSIAELRCEIESLAKSSLLSKERADEGSPIEDYVNDSLPARDSIHAESKGETEPLKSLKPVINDTLQRELTCDVEGEQNVHRIMSKQANSDDCVGTATSIKSEIKNEAETAISLKTFNDDFLQNHRGLELECDVKEDQIADEVIPLEENVNTCLDVGDSITTEWKHNTEISIKSEIKNEAQAVSSSKTFNDDSLQNRQGLELMCDVDEDQSADEVIPFEENVNTCLDVGDLITTESKHETSSMPVNDDAMQNHQVNELSCDVEEGQCVDEQKPMRVNVDTYLDIGDSIHTKLKKEAHDITSLKPSNESHYLCGRKVDDSAEVDVEEYTFDEEFIGDITYDGDITPVKSLPLSQNIEDCPDSGMTVSLCQSNDEYSLLLSRVHMVETELTKVQQAILHHERTIEELNYSLQNLRCESDNIKNATMKTMNMSQRKMHRYCILCQHQFPYPINGIHGHYGKLLVFTRRTLHIIQKTLSDDAALEDALILFEEKLAGLLRMNLS